MICLMFISMIFPTKQTLLLVSGIYMGKKTVNQIATSQKLEKINTIVDLQLNKYIKELQQK